MVTIRQASENDKPVIEDIMLNVVNWLDSTGKSQWTKEQVSWQGLSRYYSTDNLYIAYLDGEAVGCMALVDYDPAYWPDIKKGESLFIHKLAVKRSGTGKGVSNALIHFAKKECKSRNIKSIRLDCHQFRDKVRKLYENEGFICVDERCLWGKYHTAFYVWHYDDVICHYDSLIDENNDPTRDPKPLQEYMNKWDGQTFIDEMQLTADKTVLEIGVGTGRLALRVCGKCKNFVGIDISPKTIERAKENMTAFTNIELVCSDFLVHNFTSQFDTIYSSLAFMHIEDKQSAINKVSKLLKAGSRFVLSISKCQNSVLDFGNRKIKIYPDDAESITAYIENSGLLIEKQFDTEFATVFVAVRQ